ncbi:peptidoglycan-binding protein [Ectothiorhodospiraceae bacterium 2226]|nr:peptidoglycan-binding protein [Ectothiorhodospiraceae bacterium 2226]
MKRNNKAWLVVLLAAGSLGFGTALAERQGQGPGVRGTPFEAGPGAQQQPQQQAGPAQQQTETARERTAVTEQAQDREMIRAVQQALNERGHEAGPVDGIKGPRTEQALQRFKEAEGLQADAQIDEQTLRALGLEQEAGEFAAVEEPPAEPARQPGEPGVGGGPFAQ